jgi:hypothetical protein
MNTNLKTIGRVSFLLVFVVTLSSTAALQAWEWKTPSFLRLDNTWPFRDKDKPQEGTPVRMVSTWTDTVLSQPGQKPQRGFGGRIMFYDKEGKKPILVEGQLVVYAFDEAGREQTDNKPTRRYVFPADQMPVHMSKSELGASYSFWLPWDEAGGPRATLSLISRFEPKGGAVVTSEQTKHVLPGTTPIASAQGGPHQPPKAPEGVPVKPSRLTLEGIQSSRNDEHNAKLISYEAQIGAPQQVVNAGGAVQDAGAAERRMSATTITLPQNFQMPDAAAINAAAANMGYTQNTAQTPQRQPVVYPQSQQSVVNSRPYAGITATAPMQSSAGRNYMQATPQLPAISQAPLNAGAPPMQTGPTGWNNMSAGQLPPPQVAPPQMQQAGASQPTLQQQLLQQQLVQQQLQQQMMQQALQQQGMPQTPPQPGMATVSYPNQGQQVR